MCPGSPDPGHTPETRLRLVSCYALQGSRCCGTEAGSYLRLIDSCITQLKAQGPYWTCNESKEEEEEVLLCGSGFRVQSSVRVEYE